MAGFEPASLRSLPGVPGPLGDTCMVASGGIEHPVFLRALAGAQALFH